MSDRELLELAAKAAGLRVCWHDGDVAARHMDRTDPPRIYWNPLTDDGDALRLAVKLELAPSIFATSGLTFCTATNKPMSEVNIEEEHNGDPYAATRRAIVRAAAAMAPATPLEGREG